MQKIIMVDFRLVVLMFKEIHNQLLKNKNHKNFKNKRWIKPNNSYNNNKYKKNNY